MCPRARARACAFADPCGDAKVSDFIVFCSLKPCFLKQPSEGVVQRGAKWPGPGLGGKMKRFSVFNDSNGGEDDHTQNRKNIETEQINV